MRKTMSPRQSRRTPPKFLPSPNRARSRPPRRNPRRKIPRSPRFRASTSAGSQAIPHPRRRLRERRKPPSRAVRCACRRPSICAPDPKAAPASFWSFRQRLR
jgi:hypothetical protein